MTTHESNAWVSDEDFEEMEDWPEPVQANDEESAAPSGNEQPPPGTPLPEYLDEDIAAELADNMPPIWLGTRWREIPAVHQADAWNGLRRWIDWLIKEYWLTTSDIPPCWYKHSNVVAELYAAMCMEYKVWEEGEPGLGPVMFWHTNLQQIVMRLKAMNEDAGCVREGAHKEPIAYGDGAPHELDYDEADWNQHVNTTVTRQKIARPDKDVIYYRAGLVDDEGERVATSSPIGLKNKTHGDEVAINVSVASTPTDVAELIARTQNVPETVELIWETSQDGRTWDIDNKD